MLKLLLVAAVCLLAVQLARCDSPVFTDTELPCYRLPLNVRPTKYETHLSFGSLDSNVYQGQVNISVEFLADKSAKLKFPWVAGTEWKEEELIKSLRGVDCDISGAPDRIVLHADKSLDIQEVKVRTRTSLSFLRFRSQKERQIVGLSRDESKQMIAINLERSPRPRTKGTISISFKGRMRDDKRGVYLSTYSDGKQTYRHIATSFQPSDARTVFPCFDEPRFKAPFTVSLDHPSGLVAYGNTEAASVLTLSSELTRTSFVATPQMPVHMVAFVVGQFDEPLEVDSVLVKKSGRSVRKVRIITEPGKRDAGHFALDVAKRALEWFEQYIDYEFPLSKIDVIALADRDKDNTETWGLVFIRDTILWNDEETKPVAKVSTAIEVSHILIHQWFANLISPAWWTDMWITESVAAQFCMRFVEEVYPFQSEYLIRMSTLSGSMQVDQPGVAHPLSPAREDLKTSEQFYALFDTLEFMKAGSLAQMLNDAIGEEKFQKVLRSLVARHAYQTINFPDLEYAITVYASYINPEVIQMLQTFAAFRGVPLLNAYIDDQSRARVSLESFGDSKGSTNDFERVPSQDLEIFTSARLVDLSTNTHNTMELFVSMERGQAGSFTMMLPQSGGAATSSSLEVPFGSAKCVKFSPKPDIATYYRTRYSGHLLECLKAAIEQKRLEPMDRLQILDDANNLVQYQLMSNNTFKDLLQSYAHEDDSGVLIELLVASKTLAGLRTDGSPSTVGGAFMGPFERHGFKVASDETLIEQHARSLTLKALVSLGNQRVIAAALAAYEEARGNVAVFLREPVYTALVLSGSSEAGQLLARLQTTKSYDEQVRLVGALVQSKDKELLAEVQKWIQASGLKAEISKPFLATISAALAK